MCASESRFAGPALRASGCHPSIGQPTLSEISMGHFKDNLPRAIQRLTNPLQAATIRELDPPDVGLWRSLGARFHGMEEVVGSIPTRSTKYTNNLAETFQTVCPHFARKWQNLAARRHLLFSILSFLLALPFHRVTSSGCSSFAICPSFRHGWRLRF